MSADDPRQDLALTPAGAARRIEILADALRAADRRRHRRLARRSAVIAGVCFVTLGAIAVLNRTTRVQSPAPLVHVTPPPSRPSSLPAPVPPQTTMSEPRVIVQIIPADRVERHWEVINDDQLISALASAGKPSGVARLNGKAVVVPVH